VAVATLIDIESFWSFAKPRRAQFSGLPKMQILLLFESNRIPY